MNGIMCVAVNINIFNNDLAFTFCILNIEYELSTTRSYRHHAE